MRTKWQSGSRLWRGFCLIGNGPERRRAGTEVGNPTRTYAAKFTPYSATKTFLKDELSVKDDVPNQKRKKIRVKSNHTLNRKVSVSWIVTTILLTFFLSVAITVLTSSLLGNVAVSIAVFILLSIVLLGILFDILGIAVATAAEAPFHAMASNRVKGAVEAIRLIRNAEKVSNFCNDVVGDICGIVSGAAGTFIATALVTNFSLPSLLTTLFVTGTVSALTVGGKALGKTLAINQCNQIVFGIGKLISIFHIKKSRK